MSSEREIRSKLARLRELQYDIMMRISTEEASLVRKQQQLYAIQQRLETLIRQPYAILMIGEVSRLVDARNRLIQEINREQEILARLRGDLVRVQNEIVMLQQRISGITLPGVPMAMMISEEERRRQAEIRWLLDELEAINRGQIADGQRREMIIRRLRELGYPI